MNGNRNLMDRYGFVDYYRFIAIVCVVLCHSVEFVFQTESVSLGELPDMINLFRVVAFTFGRSFGVPFFLMISGFLLLDRFYDGERIKRFFINNWGHLVICTMIWFIIYDLFLKYHVHEGLSWKAMACDAFFLHQVNMVHQWYMPVIIGFYAFMPFIADMLHTLEKKSCLYFLLIPYAIVFMYKSIAPFVNSFLSVRGLPLLDPQIDMGFSGGIYGLYIIMGAFIKKGMLKRINAIILLVLAFLSTLILIVYFFMFHRYDFFLWYDSPFIIIASGSLFELGTRMKKLNSNTIIVFLAKYSFAVYLIHFMLKYFDIVWAIVDSFSRPVQVILLVVILVTVSYCIAWLIGKVPLVGKYILYVK